MCGISLSATVPILKCLTIPSEQSENLQKLQINNGISNPLPN